MKRVLTTCLTIVCAGLLLQACDWSSGGDSDFNTSRGAGVNFNLSGVYEGLLSGGRVTITGGGPITQLTIRQNGNRIEVIDNNGSTYAGSVGAPGAVADPGPDGAFGVGQELSQLQINFSGINNTTGREVDFSGVIRVVSVDDIDGTTTESTETTTEVISFTGTTNTTLDIDDGDFSSTTENEGSSEFEDESEVVVTRTTTFQITEANAQYRLGGTWVEQDGDISSVDALSAASGTITTTATGSGGGGSDSGTDDT